VARNDGVYTTDVDTQLDIAAPGVLGNDYDLDGDALIAIKVSDLQHGTVDLNADGSFSYNPDPGWFGTDTLLYKANDGELDSQVAKVTIKVERPGGGGGGGGGDENQAPTAVDDSYTTPQDTTLSVDPSGVLSNDTDPEGDPLSSFLVSGPSSGTLEYFMSDGSFEYTPNAGFSGTDTFTYRANDGQADSNTATVTITVEAGGGGAGGGGCTPGGTPNAESPLAVADMYSTSKNVPLSEPAPGVLLNDSDPDGNQIEAVLATDVSDGTLTLNCDGSFDYTPNTGFVGTCELKAETQRHGSSVR
jgi:hypothetical protein